MTRMTEVKQDELWQRMEELVKLNSHYAEILNMYDGGSRMQFKNAAHWVKHQQDIELTQKMVKDPLYPAMKTMGDWADDRDR